MREIKFRAWIKENYYDDKPYMLRQVKAVEPNGDIQINLALHETKGLYDCHSANEIELMQYTGLKDKNGVEIYEGDIIGLDGFWSYCIDFHDGAFRKIPCNQAQKLNWPWNPLEKVTIEVHGWEVVGNIYENPELLEGNR